MMCRALLCVAPVGKTRNPPPHKSFLVSSAQRERRVTGPREGEGESVGGQVEGRTGARTQALTFRQS